MGSTIQSHTLTTRTGNRLTETDPLRFVDPSGLRRCHPLVGAIVGGLGGGVIGTIAGGGLGAIAGGTIGAMGGTLVVPGLGTIGGGVGGAGVGAQAGFVECMRKEGLTTVAVGLERCDFRLMA
jgi:hypothetical protein